jgi:hypothetical protein
VNLHCTRTGRGSKRRAGPCRRRGTQRARRRPFWGRGRAPGGWAARRRPFWAGGGRPAAGAARREPPAASMGSGQNGFAGWSRGARCSVSLSFRVILFSGSFKNSFTG